MKKLYKRLTHFIISIFVLTFVFAWSIKEAPNAHAEITDYSRINWNYFSESGVGPYAGDASVGVNWEWTGSMWKYNNAGQTYFKVPANQTLTITYTNPDKVMIYSIIVTFHHSDIDSMIQFSCPQSTEGIKTKSGKGDVVFTTGNTTGSVSVNIKNIDSEDHMVALSDDYTAKVRRSTNVYTLSLNTQTTSNNTAIYLCKSDNYYLDAAMTKKMTTSANPVGKPTVPSGYAFRGYFTGQNGSGTKVINENGYLASNKLSKTLVSKNTTIYAYLEKLESELTFDNNGGTGGTESIVATKYQAMPSITLPKRPGYDFLGYYDDLTAGTKYYNADGSSAKNWDKSADTTLYARWNKKGYNGVLFKMGDDFYLYDDEYYQIGTDILTGAQIMTFYEIDSIVNIYDVSYNNSADLVFVGLERFGQEITISVPSKAPIAPIGFTVTGNGTSESPYLFESAYVTYMDWNPSTGSFDEKYLDAESVNIITQEQGQYFEGSESGTWYYLDSNLDINSDDDSYMVVNGIVNLILRDNCSLTMKYNLFNGPTLRIEEGATLNIYGQSLNTGSLTLNNGATNSGALELVGTLNVYGGTLNCNGNRCAIEGESAIVTMFGGTINANNTGYWYSVESNIMIFGGEIVSDGGEGGKAFEGSIVTGVAFDLDVQKWDSTNSAWVDATLDEENKINELKVKLNCNVKHSDVYICDTEITGLVSEGEGWSYDFETNTLTLDGFNYSGNKTAINTTNDLNIIIKGENTIVNTLNDEAETIKAIDVQGKLTITGDGTLNVSTTGKGGHNFGIWTGSTFTIDGPTINATSGNAVYNTSPLYCNNDGMFILSGKVTAIGGTSDNDYSWGLAVPWSDVTIGEDVILLEAIGNTRAIGWNGKVINYIKGTGYTDTAGTEGEENIAINLEGEELTTYKKIIFRLTPDDVIALINNIGEVEYTDASKEKIDAARKAYNSLNDTEKELITNYETLTDAEAAYALLKADYEAAEAVIALIDAIAPVEYNSDCEGRIDAAREAYDELTKDQQDLVSNYQTLVDAEKAYDAMLFIDFIGEVEYSDECLEDINWARGKYDALTDDQKALVSNYQTLLDAEADYKAFDDQAKADSVKDLISNIGKVELTDTCKANIDAARDAFDALTDAQKVLVTNINTLTSAEDRYQDLVDAKAAADLVIPLIEAIYPMKHDQDCLDRIEAARTAYNALNIDGRSFVTNIDKLLDAEKAYDVMDLINNIGNVEYTETSKDKIDTANEAYEKLTDTQKALVENYEDLEKANEDYDAVDDAVSAVSAIGEVEYTETSKNLIDAAKDAYGALSDYQKSIYPAAALDILNNAEARYQELEAAKEAADIVVGLIEAIYPIKHDQDCFERIANARTEYNKLDADGKSFVTNLDKLLDAEKAYLAMDLIDDIGTVEYTTDSKGKIDSARTVYDELTGTQKTLVLNYETLIAAEASYADLDAANAVIVLIDAIAPIGYNFDCEIRIGDARDAYDELTDAQKDLVSNYQTLVDAEKAYDVMDNIDFIGEVEYTDECLEDITYARNTYNALTDEQKTLVSNYQTLLNAEASYKSFDDQAKADAVKDLISNIGKVELTDTCKAKIDSAREEYDKLTADQKSLVTNYATLTDAEVRYQELKEAKEAADIVVGLIDAIYPIKDDQECSGRITDARTAYNALNADGRSFVTNLDKLLDAEAAYLVMNLISNIGTVEYTETSKNLIDNANEAYDELSNTQKALVANYDKLVQANDDYDSVDESVLDVLTIGDVYHNDEIKNLIDDAREAYDSLSDYQKSIYPEDVLNTLINAEKAYEAMDKIVNINDVENTDEYREAIEAAREYFDSLNETQQNMVRNEKDLIDREAVVEFMDKVNAIGDSEDTETFRNKVKDARDTYENMTDDQIELIPDGLLDLLVDNEEAIDVMDKINLIGDVDYNDTSKGLIEAAREAYEELTEGQKALVANYDKLVDAEKAYEAMGKIDDALDIEDTKDFRDKVKAARDYYDGLTDNQKGIVDNYQDLVDREAVINFMDKVNLIGDSEDTQDFRDKVEAAREAYDGLTDAQKELVSEELLNTLLDNENAISAMDKINLIGDVKYTTDSKKLIDDARTVYNALTDDQKELVVNLEKLTKAEDDYNAVDKVAKEINSIGDIRYDEESHKKIEDARKSYESLTKDQKAFFLANTLQKLEDYEESYETLEIIYSIGDVEYTHESEELIAKARERYNALTDDQKAIINENDLNVLTISETQYTNTKTSSTVWLVILMILTIIAIGGAGFILFLLLKKKDNDHNEPKKAMSVTGLPFIILASHLTDTPYIIFYIFIGIAVVFWIVDLVIFILKKKGLILKGKEQSNEEPKAEESNEEKLEEQAEESEEAAIEEPVEEPVEETTEELTEDPVEEPVEESADEPVEKTIEEPTEEPVEEATEESTDEAAEEDEVVAMEDEQGNVFKIRFNKSFTAKLIQSSDETKSYYQELKNEVLSYKKVTSRTSWAFDSINNGRNNVIRFGIRGKALCVYYPLNALDYADSKYKVENIESKKYAGTPCMYRIKNERRLSYAKELITVVCEKLQLVKGDNKNENYYLPYEDNQALIEKGLIKETKILN